MVQIQAPQPISKLSVPHRELSFFFVAGDTNWGAARIAFFFCDACAHKNSPLPGPGVCDAKVTDMWR